MNNPCGPVPLLFITGFLGSGKTTLLNRILDEAAAQGKKIGVIINEWGRVNIDSSLHSGPKTSRLKNLTTGRFSAVAFPAIFWRLLSCSPSALWMS